MAPCTRCGTFLCGACIELVGEAAYCASCVDWLHKNGPPSRWVQAIIALEIVGVVCFPVGGFLVPVINISAAVLGLTVPVRELRRIQRGEGPLRGARQAKVARALAVVNVLLLVLSVAAFLYAWYWGWIAVT